MVDLTTRLARESRPGGKDTILFDRTLPGFGLRIRAGENPAEDIRREREAPTFRAFAEEYLRRCDPLWKPSGRKTVRVYLKARILSAFGGMPLDSIGHEDVAA